MKCAACGVVVPDDRVTFMGQPICKKCMLKGFGIKTNNDKATEKGEQ